MYLFNGDVSRAPARSTSCPSSPLLDLAPWEGTRLTGRNCEGGAGRPHRGQGPRVARDGPVRAAVGRATQSHRRLVLRPEGPRRQFQLCHLRGERDPGPGLDLARLPAFSRSVKRRRETPLRRAAVRTREGREGILAGAGHRRTCDLLSAHPVWLASRTRARSRLPRGEMPLP